MESVTSTPIETIHRKLSRRGNGAIFFSPFRYRSVFFILFRQFHSHKNCISFYHSILEKRKRINNQNVRRTQTKAVRLGEVAGQTTFSVLVFIP
jgi:hypothetical protein